MNQTLSTRIAFCGVIAIAAIFCSQAGAAVITQWDFENPPNPIALNNSPAPTIGVGTATPMGMNIYPTPNVGVTTCDVLNGVSGDTGTNGNADLSQIWRVRAQAAPGGGAANGWSSLAPIGTQGVIFAGSTVGYKAINVSFDWYATNQGEAKLQLEYTTDGGATFHNVPITPGPADSLLSVLTNSLSPNTVMGSYVSCAPNALNPSGGNNWWPGLTATINDPAAANNPNFAIGIVNASTGADDVSTLGTPLNNSSGNWRFDNVTISGTAVPEPSSLVLCGLGVVGLVAGRRRRAKGAAAAAGTGN
jgi:hypothetical protein